MVFHKNEKGISIITLIITIITITILSLITINVNDNSIDEASSLKFKEEITEIKRGVETVKLINSKEGLDEKTLNKNFKKIKVKNPPDNFISFDDGEFTAYLVDLEEIDYKKIKTGQEYKNINSGDEVIFGTHDIYIYDKLGTIYYVKGIYLQGEEVQYTLEQNKESGPKVTAQNTKGGTIEITVTPIKDGEITSVKVAGEEALKIEEGKYEITVDKNGSYIVMATEKGVGTTSIKVNVTMLGYTGVENPTLPPTKLDIIINNGEPYTKEYMAKLNIDTDAELIFVKHGTTGSAPVTPDKDTSGWRKRVTEIPIYLGEGKNTIYVWARNSENNLIIECSGEIILDTTYPTRTKPTVEKMDNGSLKITSTQQDLGSGLKNIEIGYKLEGERDYTWVDVSNVNNPTVEIKDIILTGSYMVKTKAEDNVGLISESEEYTTGTLNEIPGGVIINYSPKEGWTKQSTVTIKYPEEANDSIYEKFYRINSGTWQKAESIEEKIKLEENAEVEAAHGITMGTTTAFGEITKVEIENIDSKNPIVGEINENIEKRIATTTLKDNESGIIAYKITEEKVMPSEWNTLGSATNEYEVKFNTIANKAYYVWAKDGVGNVSNRGITAYGVNINSPHIEVNFSGDRFEYTGYEIRPLVTVTESGEKLTEGNEYTVTYVDNIEIGTATIHVTGIGLYCGTKTFTFEIEKITIKETILVYMYDYTYAGEMSSPSIQKNPSGGEVNFYYNKRGETTNDKNWKDVKNSTMVDAGAYDMYAIISETDYYKEYKTPILYFNIYKATGYIELESTNGNDSNGTEIEVTAKVTNYHGGEIIPSSNNSNVTVTVNGTDINISGLEKVTPHQTITITIKSKETTNYKEAQTTYSIYIQRHDYLSPKYDNTYHWDECTNCDAYINKEKHSCYETDRESATCIENGYIEYTCDCGYSYSDPISATGHTYSYTNYNNNEHWSVCSTCNYGYDFDYHNKNSNITAEATCTEDGEIKIWCTVCDWYDTDIIEATDHDWNNGTVTKEATCVQDGEITYTCYNCGAEDTETIDAPGTHSWGDYEVTTAATCTTNGEKTASCTRSGCTAKDTQTINAPGSHSWGTYTVTTPATCTTNGQKTASCTRSGCTAKDTQTINATGHNCTGDYVPAKDYCHVPCVNTGCTAYVMENHNFGSTNKCSKCGYEKECTTHIWGNCNTKHAYTGNSYCSQQGYHDWDGYYCVVCINCGTVDSSNWCAMHMWSSAGVVNIH